MKNLSIFKNSRVIVTGHTGFKGSWLTAWLKQLGAKVMGISLDPPSFPSHFEVSKIKNSNINISESDFIFTGELESFIPYMLQKTDKMHVRGNLHSSTMLFSELLTIKDISKGEPTSSLPGWVFVDINSYVTDFTYDNFNATNLSGKIQYDNQVLKGLDLVANSLEGHLHGDFVLTEPTNNYLVLKFVP